MEKRTLTSHNSIKDKIHTIRGLQVMSDKDLAKLYGVEIKRLNEQVKRNLDRFPSRFMFQLTDSEYNSLRSQFATLENEQNLRFPNGISKKGRGEHRKYLPYVFTEQGVSMLSGVLNSKTAISVSIQIMDAFVAMRKFISSNAQIFNRLDRVEIKQIEHDTKFERVFKAIEDKDIKPSKGVFFDGQIFDSYKFVSNLIKSAKKSIVLIDNFIDESVLVMFSKRKKKVNVTIYTKNVTKQLKLDLEKFNAQYEHIKVKEFKKSHDRFMIIDDKEIYHIGASLKDLGKKWFAFSRFQKDAIKLIEQLKCK